MSNVDLCAVEKKEKMIKWLETFCGKLTEAQLNKLNNIFDIKIYSYIVGVARPCGEMYFCPLIRFPENLGHVKVLNRNGEYEIAATDGRIDLTELDEESIRNHVIDNENYLFEQKIEKVPVKNEVFDIDKFVEEETLKIHKI
jgi:hypothetical protein